MDIWESKANLLKNHIFKEMCESQIRTDSESSKQESNHFLWRPSIYIHSQVNVM